MTPYMKTIFQQKKITEILTKISGSAPLRPETYDSKLKDDSKSFVDN